ncbi:MAG: Bacterial membrane protein YfhO [uncultured Sulfurovum sp.]|uniref:Bacterial membrane protein YfhO n=1 Tax=uncultured Sulfurovum sp. TaxID=269237 RepID=A0A6S6TUL5_9BACT|nr:MAG: Bacterial membrane protein YfhO [uncultured Sulfurovum sp.]
MINIKPFITVETSTKSYIILFLIALFMLAANPFKGETVAPMDLLVKYPGWQNSGQKEAYINGERSDVLDAKLPIWISAKRTLYNGEIPLWNHQRAGKPGLIFTNSLLTPAFVVFAMIPDDALGFYLSNLVNVLIGLVGMFLFLRLFFSHYASIFGATVFMFSGFNAAWFFWAHVDTAVFTPWVMYAVFRYLQSEKRQDLILVTVSMLLLNLGGFPMVAVMTYMATAIMVLLLLVSLKKSFKTWFIQLSYLVAFSLLAVLISLLFVYPLIELLEWMGGIGYRSSGAGFSRADFALFYNPDLYKAPRVETTFYVGLLPLLFLGLTLIYALFKPKFIAWFGLLLFLYALTISFVLIDIDIIRAIPTLDSSLLTRFGFLLGLSLAIVSAYAIHTFMKMFDAKVWVLPLVILLFSLQVYQQKSLFSKFNGAVDNNSFYPQTKSLDYLQKTLKPLEHVMADSGFLIGGTLGGYGLNDWFAHSFHQGQEKELLRKIVHKPFKTPTSAMFNLAQINLDSPYIDYLGIKAILTTQYSAQAPLEFWHNINHKKPCPTLPTNKLLQPFTLKKTYTTKGISLHMATYSQAHASSDVQLTLRQANEFITTVIVKKESITDNRWVDFLFATEKTLLQGTYTIELEMLESKDAKPLTVWSNIGEKNEPLLANGTKTNLSFQMRFIQDRVLNPKYTLLNLEPNIHILKNETVNENAYYLPTLDTKVSPDYAPIKTTHFSNTKIEIEYQAKEAGWVVFPMHNYPGWQATVNGKEVALGTFLHTMPAVKINHNSVIILTYKPSYNKYLALLSLIGVLILLFLAFYYRKKDSNS